MTIKNLSADGLHTLDYVLNYTASERVEPVVSDEIKSVDIEEFIDREEQTDDYSNQYVVFSISGDYKNRIQNEVESRFEELYSDSVEDRLEILFEEQPHDGFQFYNDVANELESKSGEENSLQPHESEYDNLVSLLETLQEIGLGFRRRYLTTTDNYYEEFEFRYHPFDGLTKFLEIVGDIVEDHLENLSPAQTWAAYVNAYVSSVNDNLGGYSPDQIETALEKPQVTAKENITFLNEEIKRYLHNELRKAIHQDTYYLSTLEFIKAGSRQESSQPKRSYTFDQALLEDLPSTWGENLENYIEQLHNRGLLLDDTNQYLLTQEVISVLEDIEERSKIESYAIETLSDAHDVLYQIFAQADEEVKIIDRYFTNDALRIVESNLPNNVRIRVLYSDSVGEGDIEGLKDELNERSLDDSKYKLKQMQSSDDQNVPHDRFIIIDNEKVWQVGHSLNGLGNAFSTIFSHSEKESPRYVRLFDELWQTGEDLAW